MHKHTIVAFVLTLALGLVSGHAQAHLATITKEVVLAHSTHTFPLPDPQWIGKTDTFVAVRYEGTHPWIERVSAIDGSRRRLVEGEAPVPSPDGRTIAYLVLAGKQAGLWACSSDGSNARKLAHLGADLGKLSTGNVQLAWSSDSTQLAYSTLNDPGDPVVTGKSTVQVFSGDTDKNTGVATIGILSLHGNRLRTIVLPRKLGDLQQLAWRHGKNGFVVRTIERAPGEGSDFAMYSVDAVTGAMHELVGPKTDQHVRSFSLSPRNDTLAIVGGHGGTRYPVKLELGLISPSGQLRYLTHDAAIGSIAWRPDGSGFYYYDVSGSFLQTHIFSGDVSGARHLLVKHEGTLMGTLSVSPNGKYLIWVSSDLNDRTSLCIYTIATRHMRSIQLNDPTAGYDLGETSGITWKSRDGLPIEGILIKPVGYQPGNKYPMIVDIHGGPQGGLANAKGGPFIFDTPLEHHFWATQGFVVFMPDYRESRAGGWKQFELRRKHNDYFERDFDDIMSGVDTVIATGMVDQKRMVVTGHSWGSWVTNWLITHTHRFAAAISFEGSANLTLDWGNPNRQTKPNEWRFNDTTPVTRPDLWRKENATTYVSYVKTPTMFINGQTGVDSPSLPWMYAALRRQGVESVYLCYQNEGHVISQMPNKIDLFDRTYNWIIDHAR